ncbi:hypothetical protein [Candidatus Anaplasma sp. TIGMIC]|nr:hypothetical protein [Candidatus Anaplasma sp. TIGMIC]
MASYIDISLEGAIIILNPISSQTGIPYCLFAAQTKLQKMTRDSSHYKG